MQESTSPSLNPVARNVMDLKIELQLTNDEDDDGDDEYPRLPVAARMDTTQLVCVCCYYFGAAIILCFPLWENREGVHPAGSASLNHLTGCVAAAGQSSQVPIINERFLVGGGRMTRGRRTKGSENKNIFSK